MIKCIMVDMDGTFLSKGDGYNVARFASIYDKLNEQGIAFVVASGNQYACISRFFTQPDLYYAAENGAWISHKGKDLFVSHMDFEAAMNMFALIKEFLDVDACICGKRSAYVLEAHLLPRMSICFPLIQVIEDVSNIQDDLFKIALETPLDKTEEILAKIQAVLPETMEAVNSGFGCIDINQVGIHKGSALLFLCEHLHIAPSEVMAFGDSGNDLAMIQAAGLGIAMGNAQTTIKAEADYVAPTCQAEGVLTILEQFLQGSFPPQ